MPYTIIPDTSAATSAMGKAVANSSVELIRTAETTAKEIVREKVYDIYDTLKNKAIEYATKKITSELGLDNRIVRDLVKEILNGSLSNTLDFSGSLEKGDLKVEGGISLTTKGFTDTYEGYKNTVTGTWNAVASVTTTGAAVLTGTYVSEEDRKKEEENKKKKAEESQEKKKEDKKKKTEQSLKEKLTDYYTEKEKTVKAAVKDEKENLETLRSSISYVDRNGIASTTVALIKQQALSYAAELVGSQIEKAVKALQGVKKGLDSVGKLTSKLESTGKTILVAVTALQIAVNLIKVNPTPQAKIPMGVTNTQGDTLAMLRELITQAKEQAATLTSIAQLVNGYVKPAKLEVDKADSIIACLKAFVSLNTKSKTTSDVEKLQDAGLIDEKGDDIFGKIIDAAKDDDDYILWGDLVPNSKSDPKASITDVTDDLSYDKDTSIKNKIDTSDIGDKFNWDGRDITILDPNNVDKGVGIIPINMSYSDLTKVNLTKLSKLTLSDDLMAALRDIAYTPVEEIYEETGGNKVTYVASTGEIYTLEIKIDTKTPTVASRHYVEARDESGTVVLESPPTFTLNTKNLIEDMQVRLESLTL